MYSGLPPALVGAALRAAAGLLFLVVGPRPFPTR